MAGLRPSEILIILMVIAVISALLAAIVLSIFYVVKKTNRGKGSEAPVDQAGPSAP